MRANHIRSIRQQSVQPSVRYKKRNRTQARKLNLEGRQMSDSKLKKYYKQITETARGSVRLRDNHITEEGLIGLLKALNNKKGVEGVDCQQNWISSKVVPMLYSIRKKLRHLKRLNLKNNFITRKHIKKYSREVNYFLNRGLKIII